MRDCGVKAVAAATNSGIGEISLQFADKFGSIQVNGKQMRQYLTERGWMWTRVTSPLSLPTKGIAIVVTRRGFFALHDGTPNMIIDAPVCGYYTPPEVEAKSIA